MIISLILTCIFSALFSSTIRSVILYGFLFIAVGRIGHKIKDAFTEPTYDHISAAVRKIESRDQISIEAGLLGRRSRLVTLYGVDCREEAKEWLENKLPPESQISIDITQGKKLGTSEITGIIKQGNTIINCELIRQGLAKNTSKQTDFRKAEKEAKRNGKFNEF